MNLNFLFSRRPTGSRRREPHLDIASEPVPTASRAALAPPRVHAEVNYMSPREMCHWAHEMYLCGALTWPEYQAAIPAEVHPDYDTTIGALTGLPAAPDRPRDMVKEWEDKLDFFRRYSAWDGSDLRRTERIVTLLRRQADPQQWAAG